MESIVYSVNLNEMLEHMGKGEVEILGGKFAEAGSRQNMALCLFLTLCSLLALFCSGISLTGLALLCLFQALLIGKFVFWSRHYGGYSGDFIGALMETGQCLCLVCTL